MPDLGKLHRGSKMAFFENHAVLIGLITFVLMYAGITFEHLIGIQKEPISLIGGGLLWIIAILANRPEVEHDLEVAGAEIAEIVFFLMAAMTLVEFLDQKGFFELIRVQLQRRSLGDRQQFVVICFVTFFLSAALDNLTTTLVMLTIAERFFRGNNRQVVSAAIVPNANAGGAWSPVGDVTTIMLWVAGAFTAGQIVSQAFLPSVAHATVVTVLMLRHIVNDPTPDSVEDLPLAFSREDKILMAAALACFCLPLFANQMGLHAYMGLLFGLGVVWLLNQLLSPKTAENGEHLTKMEHDIEDLIRKIDHRSLIFFAGILLGVKALGTLGVLEKMSEVLLGDDPSSHRVGVVSYVLGPVSAIVDNVPLTALSIDVFPFNTSWEGTRLALAVGTGGSLLLIGSVAGVVAMGKVVGLTSGRYFRLATVPVALGFIAQMLVFELQRFLFS